MRVLLLSLFLVAGCGSTMKVSTNDKTAQDVARFRTYTHETAQNAPEGYARTDLAPLVAEKARATIDAQLGAKGYVLAENNPDLVVRLSTGARVVAKEPTGTAVMVGAPTTKETQGEIVIDIFDRASGAQVFHGYAQDESEPGKVDEKKVADAVTKILAPIPPSQAAPPK